MISLTSNQRNIQHLLLRAGFGNSPLAIVGLYDKSITTLVDLIFEEAKSNKPLDYIKDPLQGREEEVSNFKILAMILKSKASLEELNLVWMDQMVEQRFGLREKMTLFWHNFFSCSAPFAWLMQNQNNFLRMHALGNFKDLLRGIAKDPAMILYLNNQQNKKHSPNENFAREVMELFSLGIGNYSENDIKEAARCFTGWTVNRLGRFELVMEEHDDGEKTIFGKKGYFSGEDVINILLENPKTAERVVRMMYKEFVNPNPNEERIKNLAMEFFDSGYDISKLLHSFFLSDWFYDEENVGKKICSPIEWLVRLRRLTGFITDDNKSIVHLQYRLGQVLFFPPNVGGWPGGRNWINSNALLLRMGIPLVLAKGEGIHLQGKESYDNEAEKDVVTHRSVQFSADWRELENYFSKISDTNRLEAIAAFFFQVPIATIMKSKVAESFKNNQSKVDPYQIAEFLSLPEFQLI
jgi:uncharacterized protein (DUF1800 family)